MIYTVPTTNGLGIELWGNADDLDSLYNVIAKFWGNEENLNHQKLNGTDSVISSFSYEIRKAKDGQRLTRDSSHFSLNNQKCFGSRFTWVHILFALSSVKYGMRFNAVNKYDISQILQLEFWIEKAMNTYDKAGAKNLIGFIEDGLWGANQHIYQCMRSVNANFLRLGGGKRAFKHLPELLKRGVYGSEEFKQYEIYLSKEAKRLNCDSSDLEINDDDIDYENLSW